MTTKNICLEEIIPGNPVLESAKFIFEHSKDVQITKEGIYNAANIIFEKMKQKEYSVKHWKMNDLHPQKADEAAINWIFLVDLLNFSFWSDLDKEDIPGYTSPDRYTVFYNNRSYTGYWSLCAAINRALQKGIPITTPDFYASKERLSDLEIKQIFKSETSEDIPLLEERIESIRQAGKILTERFNGTFATCIQQANQSSLKLLTIIVENFPSFRDEASFLGRTVKFYKRAQILIADIWYCYNNQNTIFGLGYGTFHDIDEITMFADYRVPQALHHLQALSYSPFLKATLDNYTLLENGSQLEIEIRGCSIWAVELIRRHITQKLLSEDGKNETEDNEPLRVNAILLDYYIWDFASSSKTALNVKAHRIRSIFY
ncbi:3124_t:CDS:10 [Ambispora leptoticha]|uniref:Queuosine 5'-phosphate N-glycosylase/hydrolase n=1 Tax=Ambispora leptoticha TaxID=144679 RepID=A0A9N8YNL5_9GLOM|nr:3124_t:CDS:10 [Ambispora leptoticha]